MGIINPYYWVDDHPLLYGNNGSLDPGTYKWGEMGSPISKVCFTPVTHVFSAIYRNENDNSTYNDPVTARPPCKKQPNKTWQPLGPRD